MTFRRCSYVVSLIRGCASVQYVALGLRIKCEDLRGLAIADHPILGGVLFGIGFILVAFAYPTPDPLPLLLLGHVFVFNGASWVILWCRKQQIGAHRTR
jgi:hypothetical protein